MLNEEDLRKIAREAFAKLDRENLSNLDECDNYADFLTFDELLGRMGITGEWRDNLRKLKAIEIRMRDAYRKLCENIKPGWREEREKKIKERVEWYAKQCAKFGKKLAKLETSRYQIAEKYPGLKIEIPVQHPEYVEARAERQIKEDVEKFEKYLRERLERIEMKTEDQKRVLEDFASFCELASGTTHAQDANKILEEVRGKFNKAAEHEQIERNKALLPLCEKHKELHEKILETLLNERYREFAQHMQRIEKIKPTIFANEIFPPREERRSRFAVK